jgi:hypothetical protein
VTSDAIVALIRTDPEAAVAYLAAATTASQDDAALRAFLALALHFAGHATLALATMLEAALAGFEHPQPALVAFQKELVDDALTR